MEVGERTTNAWAATTSQLVLGPPCSPAALTPLGAPHGARCQLLQRPSPGVRVTSKAPHPQEPFMGARQLNLHEPATPQLRCSQVWGCLRECVCEG